MDIYDLLEHFSIMTIDGGITDEEALAHIRKTYPQTLENGVYNEFLEKTGKLPDNTEKNAPKADFMRLRPNYDTLSKYLAFGFTLYARRQSKEGQPQFTDWKNSGANWTQETAAIKTESDLALCRRISPDITRFTFSPAEKDFICLDLDRHNNGFDGVKIFNGILDAHGIESKRGIFADVENGSFPAFVKSPNNGLHLYFKNDTWTKENRPAIYLTFEGRKKHNIDVIFYGNQLTAAGSLKQDGDGNWKEYTPGGNIFDPPLMPLFFSRLLTKDKSKETTPELKADVVKMLRTSKRKHEPEGIEKCIYCGIGYLANNEKTKFSQANRAEILEGLATVYPDITPGQLDSYITAYFAPKNIENRAAYIQTFFERHPLSGKGNRHNELTQSHIPHFVKLGFGKAEIVNGIMNYSNAYNESERKEIENTVDNMIKRMES